jgi:hypothetical protein
MRSAMQKSQQLLGLLIGLYREIAISALSLIPGRDSRQRSS